MPESVRHIRISSHDEGAEKTKNLLHALKSRKSAAKN